MGEGQRDKKRAKTLAGERPERDPCAHATRAALSPAAACQTRALAPWRSMDGGGGEGEKEGTRAGPREKSARSLESGGMASVSPEPHETANTISRHHATRADTVESASLGRGTILGSNPPYAPVDAPTSVCGAGGSFLSNTGGCFNTRPKETHTHSHTPACLCHGLSLTWGCTVVDQKAATREGKKRVEEEERQAPLSPKAKKKKKHRPPTETHHTPPPHIRFTSALIMSSLLPACPPSM